MIITVYQTVVYQHSSVFDFEFYNLDIYDKNYFRNTFRVPNNLVPDQVPLYVGLDLGPNCLQRLSADMINYFLTTEQIDNNTCYFVSVLCHRKQP